MEDRFRYSAVRQRIIDAMKTDLMGPLMEEEVLDENPRHAYVIGLLAPQTDLSKGSEDDTSEQEIESVITHEDGSGGCIVAIQAVMGNLGCIPRVTLPHWLICGLSARPVVPREV